MAFELTIDLALNRDRILKQQLDQQIKGRLQILSGRFGTPTARAKVNLVFVLDSSGSMDSPYYATGKAKRQIVYDAVKYLISSFDRRDTVSLVSFNSQAVIHVDHSSGGDRGVIEAALEKYLTDNGGTNFEAAMKMVDSVCRNQARENYKVIFLTDGNAESGNSANALEICRHLAEKGVTTDAMGIGDDFNFNFMKQFSDLSGSKTENLTRPDQASQVFNAIYACSSNVYLKKVFINLHFSQDIRDLHFYMHEPEQKNLHQFIRRDHRGSTVQVNAGDIEQEAFKEFLFDFRLDTPDTANLEIAKALIHFDCPSENLFNQKLEQTLYLNLANTEAAEIVDSSIETAYKDIEILEKQNDFHKFIEQKNFAQAAGCLERMAAMAESVGDHDKARHFREMKNKLMRDENITQAELNAISYNSSRSSVKSMIQSRQKPRDPLV